VIDVAEPPDTPTIALSAATSAPPSELHRRLDALASEVETGRLSSAQRELSLVIAEAEQGGQPDEVLASRCRLARTHAKAQRSREAAAEYGRVVMLWEADKGLSHVGSSGDPDRPAKLARALNAVGEAMYFQAEQLRAQADTVRVPPAPPSRYRRPSKRIEDMTDEEREAAAERRSADTEAFQRYVQNGVKTWMDQKKKLLEDADKAYLRVAQLQPSAPPIWLVASASRVGQMWSGFADDFRRIPMVGWMQSDPEISRVYRQALENASEPIVQRARAAFTMCKTVAERHSIDNERTRACRQWLAANP